jgi:hypothetical protein
MSYVLNFSVAIDGNWPFEERILCRTSLSSSLLGLLSSLGLKEATAVSAQSKFKFETKQKYNNITFASRDRDGTLKVV